MLVLKGVFKKKYSQVASKTGKSQEPNYPESAVLN